VGVCADLMARLGLPALGALVFLATLALAAACWVLGSYARADRVSRVLLAWGATQTAYLMTPCRRRRCLRPSADGSCRAVRDRLWRGCVADEDSRFS
jgi:hypothetical protein